MTGSATVTQGGAESGLYEIGELYFENLRNTRGGAGGAGGAEFMSAEVM